MELLFLGTGTSEGVPLIDFEYADLDLDNPKNWRTRSSIHLAMGGEHIQVDAGPEFRLQCLWNGVRQVDHFILTHGHADHLLGMDDLRRFCWDKRLPVYAAEEGRTRIEQVFPYALGDKPASRGYPCFELKAMPRVLDLKGGRVRSFDLPHGAFESLGLVFEDLQGRRIAYFNDCSGIGPDAMEASKGADIVILDALRRVEHPAHMTLDQAIGLAHALEAKQTFFTHMTGIFDHERDGATLPAGMAFAFDGLRLSLD